MCGLAGIVDLGGLDATALAPRLDAAIRRLTPRGPDAQARYADPHAALVHARLKIIDLSDAAAQPMARHGAVLVYNGEIYNFKKLRGELEALGCVFESRSDSEVLLAGWRHWGRDLLPRLNGMFAFALWMPEAKRLVLARDRMGKKPLLFRHDGQRLAFASDLAALEALGEHRGEIDRAALGLLFSLRYLPEPHAILAGIEKLPPGHFATFDDSGMVVERWYSLATERAAPPAGEAAAEAGLRERFDAAVADRLVADVPLGVFLSGGIDSALVAASMAAGGAPVQSFTVGFEGAADYYEERPAARAIARHLGTEHTEIEVTPADALAALDGVFEGLDEPFADSSALPTFLLARETRRHVTVALSGDGADELFGGYRKYQGELAAGRYQALPALLRRGLIEPAARWLPESKSSPLFERFRRVRRFLAHAGKPPVARQAGWARLFGEAELARLFTDSLPAPDLDALYAAARARAEDGDPINAMLAADLEIGLAGDMLVKVDRMSMANSLEVRCPFLDHRVVEWAAGLPGPLKLAPGEGKRILRRAFADRLPAEVFARPKKGFEIPVAQWLSGPLADLTRRAIDPARLAREGLFRPELPARWYDDLAARRRDTSEALWTLICFQSWAERFGYAGEAMA